MNNLPLLQLVPQFYDFVWGGTRLRPGQRTAEAWMVHEDNRVAGGPLAGRTLAELADQYAEALLGNIPFQHTGKRFPLLIKLLDIAQWLSVQVHPNDEQAKALEGPGQFGKTEAWHVLEAEAGASIIAGLKAGATARALADAVRGGTVVELAQRLAVHTGDTILIPPGAIHALGPGLLAYEIQQTSTITYRIFDWNRPQTAGRALHLEQSLAVADPALLIQPHPAPTLNDGDHQVLTRCAYFTLELLAAHTQEVSFHPGGQSFHALTVIEGQARVTCGGQETQLRRMESLVVPASRPGYTIIPEGELRLLKASVE